MNQEGRGLASLLLCTDDKPLSGRPFLDELTSGSVPPSLQALSPEAAQSSIVESIDDQFGPIFHLFSKRDAIYLAECGVPSDQLCYLVHNSSKALQAFPRYLQRLLEKVDSKSAENAFGGSEDLGAFLDWVISPPEKPLTRKVFCRVEGSDDALLLHAVFMLKLPSLQRLQQHLPGSWKDFSYSCPSAVVKIRDRSELVETKVSEATGPKTSASKEPKFNMSALGHVRSLQGIAQVKKFQLCWLDLDDQDLKAFETRPKQRPEPERDLSLFTWR